MQFGKLGHSTYLIDSEIAEYASIMLAAAARLESHPHTGSTKAADPANMYQIPDLTSIPPTVAADIVICGQGSLTSK